MPDTSRLVLRPTITGKKLPKRPILLPDLHFRRVASGRNSGILGEWLRTLPPGHGKRRNFFKLYALDAKRNIQPGADKGALVAAMSGRVIGGGQLLVAQERESICPTRGPTADRILKTPGYSPRKHTGDFVRRAATFAGF